MFGKRLRELRLEKDKSQKDIATLLGLSDRSIGYYESGDRQPDNDTLSKLADYFSVSIDYLLGRTNDRRSQAQIVSDSLSGSDELVQFWDELKDREELQILFKQTRDLSPEAIKKIIRIIKAIEDEESQEN
jgi:transcriptional regulator with XRE-family HTH domain